MKASLVSDDHGARFVVTGVGSHLVKEMQAFGFRATDAGFERSFHGHAGDIEAIFLRWRESIEPMVRQLGGLDPVPWEAALARFVEVVGDDVDWWLVGSAALAVRGIDARPGDIDVVVAESDFQRLTQMLDAYVVEPVSESETWIARWFCRGFMGARVEWVAGVRPWVDGSALSDFGPAAESRRESVSWAGGVLRVPPLDLQLDVCRRRGLDDRVQKIEEFLVASGRRP